MTKYKLLLTYLSILLFTTSTLANQNKPYSCGLSTGYPPYQFRVNDKTTGFDADVLRLVFEKANKELKFKQMKWSDIFSLLYYSNELDCVGGMEINKERKEKFDFTSPYYSRKIVLFTLSKNTTITKIEDLIGKKITGDKHSSIENLLKEKGLSEGIRIKRAKSKEESMLLLKSGVFSAMIAPKAVGLYLAKKYDVSVKILLETKYGSPVGIAVKKDNQELLQILENSLLLLIQDGEIDKLYNNWFN